MQALEVVQVNQQQIENAIFQSEMSPEDKGVLFELLTQNNKSISLSITPTIEQGELERHMIVAGNAHNNLGRALSILKPIIGQMLVIISKREDLYKGMGYRSFNDFMTNGATKYLGIARSSVYSSLKLAREWPSLEIGRYRSIGSSKMDVLSSATTEENSVSEDLLKIAEDPQVTADMLRKELSVRGFGDADNFKGASINVKCPEAGKLEFEEMLAERVIYEGLGITTPWGLLSAMMADSKSSLYQQGKANLGI